MRKEFLPEQREAWAWILLTKSYNKENQLYSFGIILKSKE